MVSVVRPHVNIGQTPSELTIKDIHSLSLKSRVQFNLTNNVHFVFAFKFVKFSPSAISVLLHTSAGFLFALSLFLPGGIMRFLLSTLLK